MGIKTRPSIATAPKHAIACIGDSYTYNATLGTLASDHYPYQLQQILNASPNNALVKARNLGISGQTTANMVPRASKLAQFEVPAVTVIYGGVNDSSWSTTVQASPAPTTSTFSVASGKGAGYGAGAHITVNGTACVILTVTGDAIVLTAALGFTPSAGHAVVIDTRANLKAIGQAAIAGGCTKIVVCGQHYLNWSSGGDTHGTPLAADVTLRGTQSGAVTDLNGVGATAIYVDLFAFMDARIQGGLDVQGSASWHVLDLNTHLNAYGENLIAQAMASAIAAQSGWLVALQ